MFDKRLLSLVPGVSRLVLGKVVGLWVSLLMDIAFVFTLVGLLSVVFVHVEPLALLSCARKDSLSNCLAAAHGSHAMQYAPSGTFATDGINIGGFVLAFILIGVCKYGATVMAAHFGNRAAQCVKLELRERLYRKMLRLGPSYAQRVRTSEVVQSAGEGIEQVQSFFELFLPQLVFAVIAPLTLFFVLLPVNALAAVVLLAGVPLIVIITGMVAMKASRMFRTYWGKYTDMGATFLDNLQGLETLKTFDADQKAAERMNAKGEAFRVATMRVLQIQLRSLSAMDMVAYGGAAAGILAAVWQFAFGRIWLPDAMIVILLSSMFFLPVRQLGSYFHVAMNGMTSSRRVFALLDAPEPRHGTVNLPADADAVSVSFDHVSFEYDADSDRNASTSTMDAVRTGDDSEEARTRKALDDVCLSADPGSLTAIVGASGSGKSTMSMLVAGELTGYTGSIMLRYQRLTGEGRVELADLTQESLVSQVTLVTTQSYLLAGTLRENLTMAKPDATDNELWRVLKRARIDGFVYKQSKGLDMRIEQGAANLSGGQRQRLCLARALLHDTPVYIFDEATSSVDARSEGFIVQAIRELAVTHTVFMVTHRLADAVHADRILVMDHGHVAESGDHESLMSAGGVYASMFRVQQSVETVASRRKATHEHVEVGNVDVGRITPVAAMDVDSSAATGSVSQSKGSDSNRKADSAHSKHPDRSSRSSLGVFALIWRLLSVVGKLTPYMAQACLYGVIGHLAATLMPVCGVFALFALLGRPIHGIGAEPAIIAMVVCALIRGVMRYAEQFMNHHVAFRLLALFRAKVFDALRRLAPAKLVGKGKGDLIAMVTTDVELLEIFFAHTISPVIIAVVTTIVFAVIAGFMNPWFALLIVVAHMIVGVVLPRLFASYVRGIGPRLRDQSSALDDTVLDDMRGLGEITRYGRSPQRLQNIIDRTLSLRSLQSKLNRRTSRSKGFAGVVVMLAGIAAAVLTLILGHDDPSAIPMCIAAVVLIIGSFGPVLALSALPANLTQTFASARRLFSLIDEAPAVNETGSATPRYHGMALRHVDFSYERHPQLEDDSVDASRDSTVESGTVTHRVLRDYSLAVPEIGVLGIQGHSGRGKSTVLRLLMRYWDPQRGTVTFSGIGLPMVNASHRRRMQTMMSQETYLFDGTIRENLVMARPVTDQAADSGTDTSVRSADHNLDTLTTDSGMTTHAGHVSDEALYEALRQASALELVRGLPAGLDTQVGELGGRLSEGERQRIGLARVFLRDARLALFDEPTSRVDSLNEAVILHSISALADQGTAVVLVSHREQAMRIADTVVRM